ncbi:MAG: hypothetical protein ACLR1K_00175 [Oscillospiraceae bacterium]
MRDTVRRHGGWVTAQRRQSEGAVFTVGFPARPPKWEVTSHEACLCSAAGPAADPVRL